MLMVSLPQSPAGCQYGCPVHLPILSYTPNNIIPKKKKSIYAFKIKNNNGWKSSKAPKPAIL